MNFIAIGLIVAYFAAGQFWWQRIVITPNARQAQPEEWQKMLVEGDARHDLAMLIPKGTFMLFWPLALLFGWLSARIS